MVKKKPKKKKIPWAKIRTRYETGKDKPTIRELAKKFKVGTTSIVRHSKKEGWMRGRLQHDNKVDTKAREKIVEQQSDGMAKYINILEELLDDLVEKVGVAEVKSLEGVVREIREIIKQLGLYMGKPTDRVEISDARVQRLVLFIGKLPPKLKSEYLDIVEGEYEEI